MMNDTLPTHETILEVCDSVTAWDLYAAAALQAILRDEHWYSRLEELARTRDRSPEDQVAIEAHKFATALNALRPTFPPLGA